MSGEADEDRLKRRLAAALLMEKMVRDSYSDKSSGSIQPLQWSILRYLERAEREQCTARSIGNYIGITAAPVSRAIATLEKRGYITTIKNEKDARSRYLLLTQKGKDVLVEDPLLNLARQLDNLPENRILAMERAITALAIQSSSSS